jgi:hypothetical protein
MLDLAAGCGKCAANCYKARVRDFEERDMT